MDLSISALHSAYAAGELSPAEVVEACAAAIERADPAIGAFVALTLEHAFEDARALGSQAGELPLFGVPVGVKEIIDVAGAPITGGSLVFEGRVAESDATVVTRLRQAGALVIGITRSHELAWGITTQHDALGGTRNPWDPERVPGGSSGGSAAAVAMRMISAAIGTDTACSVRIPAAFCGVVGFKPSFGRVSRAGVIPLAPSCDHVGPIASSVADAAAMFSVMDGADPSDPQTQLLYRGGRPLPRRIRFGVCPDLHLVELVDDHRAVFDRTVSLAAGVGEVIEVSCPSAAEGVDAFSAIQLGEALDAHQRTMGIGPERAALYGPDVARRVELARTVSLGDYLAGTEARARLSRDLVAIFERVDALLLPVAAGPPALIASPATVVHRGSETAFRDTVIPFTAPENLAGVPSCALPAGYDEAGLPVGVQVVGPRGEDRLCLETAMALEAALPPARMPPGALT